VVGEASVKPFLSEARVRGPAFVGERLVQLFDRRRTSTTAPGIPTPREPAPSPSGPATSLPTVSAPTAPADEPVPHKQEASDREVGAAACRSGTDGAPTATDMLYVLVPSGSADGFTPATVVEATATGGGAGGWMLLALHGQRRHWSMPLLSRGAAMTAPPRVAQAVAVRVLNDLGVHVRAWHGYASADQPKYRAELDAPPEPRPTAIGRPKRGHPSARHTANPTVMVSRADLDPLRPHRHAARYRTGSRDLH
jgi:hypothetical protein